MLVLILCCPSVSMDLAANGQKIRGFIRKDTYVFMYASYI